MNDFDYVVGLDISLNSPGLVVFSNSCYAPDSGIYYYLSNKKVLDKSLVGTIRPKFTQDVDVISWTAEYINSNIPPKSLVFIEDYAFSRTSRGLTQLHELNGVIKYLLHKRDDVRCCYISPTKVKKFATGNGRASKNMMLLSYYNEDGSLDLLNLFKVGNNVNISPVDDLIDAYFICKCGLNDKILDKDTLVN